jgi:hypothetical protein
MMNGFLRGYVEGLSVRAEARLLSVPDNAVTGQLDRGRKQLSGNPTYQALDLNARSPTPCP